jgi:cbb3-type cytochrome oxidase subunit 3
MIRSLLMEDGSWGAALGLLVFLALFAGMLAWVFRPGSKRKYERNAAMPLDDGTVRKSKSAKTA